MKKKKDITHVKDLKADPRQIRKHTQRNIGLIGDGLQAVGAARSIVIDEDNVILAGNGTAEAAAERGITKVRVIDADGNELIAVRRRGLTEKQKVELALYDNRSGDVATYDLAALTEVTDMVGVDVDTFFRPEELNEIEIPDPPPASVSEPEPVIIDGANHFRLRFTPAEATEFRAAVGHARAMGAGKLADAVIVMVRAYMNQQQTPP